VARKPCTEGIPIRSHGVKFFIVHISKSTQLFLLFYFLKKSGEMIPVGKI